MTPMIDGQGNPWFQEYKLGQLPSRSPDTELIRTPHNLTVIELHDAARYYLAFGETVAQPPDRVLILCVAHDTVVFGSDADWSIPQRWAATPETWCEGCRNRLVVAPRQPEQVFVPQPVPVTVAPEPEPEPAPPVPVAEEPPPPPPTPEPEAPPLPDPEPPVEPYELPAEPPPPPAPDPVPFVEPLPVVDPPPPEPEPYYLPPTPEAEAVSPGSPVIDMAALEAASPEAAVDPGTFQVPLDEGAAVPPPAPEPKPVKVDKKPAPLEVSTPVVAAYTALRARIEGLEAEIEGLKLEGSNLLLPLAAFSPSFEIGGQWYMLVNKGGKYHLSFLSKKPGRPTKGSEP